MGEEKGNLAELIAHITAGMINLAEELEVSMKNASAARRARNLTLELAKQFKEFRAMSNAHFKK